VFEKPNPRICHKSLIWAIAHTQGKKAKVERQQLLWGSPVGTQHIQQTTQSQVNAVLKEWAAAGWEVEGQSVRKQWSQKYGDRVTLTLRRTKQVEKFVGLIPEASSGTPAKLTAADRKRIAQGQKEMRERRERGGL